VVPARVIQALRDPEFEKDPPSPVIQDPTAGTSSAAPVFRPSTEVMSPLAMATNGCHGGVAGSASVLGGADGGGLQSCTVPHTVSAPTSVDSNKSVEEILREQLQFMMDRLPTHEKKSWLLNTAHVSYRFLLRMYSTFAIAVGLKY
jgi:hypothetical protein